MKEHVLKNGKHVIILFVVLVGFPRYFKTYPDFRFFWNICAVLGIGIQVFAMAAGNKEELRSRINIILILLLSVAMSNGYYSFTALSAVFPFLGRITERGLFTLGALAILFFAACGGIVRMLEVRRKIREKAAKELSVQAAAAAAAVCESAIGSEVEGCFPAASAKDVDGGEDVDGGRNVERARTYPLGGTWPFRHVFGMMAAVIGIALPAAVIFYALCKNQDFLLRLTSQRLPYLAFNLLTGFVIVLASVFVVTILIFYFIQMCCSIIGEMVRQRRLDIENDSLLKCVSVFMTLFFFYFYRDSTMKDLFALVNGSNEMMSLLSVVVAFTVLAFVTLMIYKILKSFAHPDGALREYANKIFSLVITTVGDMIINILEIVSKAPNLLNIMLDAVKRGADALWKILFHMDEDDFESFYH